MLKNVATKSNNVTARSTTAKNKADSSFAEPSPSKKKIINYIFTWDFTISHRRERKSHGPLRAQIKQG